MANEKTPLLVASRKDEVIVKIPSEKMVELEWNK